MVLWLYIQYMTQTKHHGLHLSVHTVTYNKTGNENSFMNVTFDFCIISILMCMYSMYRLSSVIMRVIKMLIPQVMIS